jgi:hypothetical protein
MDQNRTPITAAQDAAYNIRELNHLTLCGPALSAPQISSVMQALVQLVDRLPQTLEQLGQHLEKRLSEDAVRMDTGQPPAQAVAEVLARLAEARVLTEPANYEKYGMPAGPLSNAVHSAASLLFAMGAPILEDDDE